MPCSHSPLRILTLLSLAASLAISGCGGGDSGSGTSALVVESAGSADGPPAPEVLTQSRQAAELSNEPTDAADDTEPSTSSTLTTQSFRVSAASFTSVQAASVPIDIALEIWVAVDGNDSWSGSTARPNAGRTDGPKLTIAGAQNLARLRLAEMNAGAQRRPILVRIESGEYRLTAPLTFTSADSGVPGAPVVYRAEVTGNVTLSGAIPVATMVGAAAGTLMQMPPPALDAAARRGGSQLIVNGKRATLARAPNEGNYWFVQKQVPLATEPSGATGQEAFIPPAEALSLINGLSAADRSQAMVKVYQAWSAGRHRLSSLAAPAGAVRVTPRTFWPFLGLGPNQRFFVENVAAALDAPGEWVWDASGMRYISTAADVGKTLRFEMPVLEQLVVIKGNATAGVWVQDLELRGLKFANTRLLTPDAGFVDNQAGVTVGAAIEVDAARRVVIDSCSIDRTGGYGVWLRNAVRDSQVTNCSMRDLGAGGVKVGLTAQLPTDLNGTGVNQIRNNTIDGTGKLVPGAVGVWIGQSSDNTVANNLIANTSYTAISVGWNWKYGTATAVRNRVTANLLLNIGNGQLSDIGGVYTLGESTGTVISGNIIHQVRPYPGYGAGAWGLYNDEASTGITWERNIVIGTDAGGYLLHYGRNNIVRNNLLAHGDRGEVRVTRSDPLLTKLAFNNNLLIPKNQYPLNAFANAPDVLYSGNKVSSRALPGVVADIAKCGGGCVAADVTVAVGADPRVISLVGADATTATWVAEVGAAVGPPGLSYAPPPPPSDPTVPPPAPPPPAIITTPPPVVVAPPIAYSDEFATTAVGGQPTNMRYITGGSNSAISIQTDASVPSSRSLRFVDSAAIRNRWEPYAWANLNHTKAVSTVEFTVRIDAATNFLHEWRDDANVFTTGPSLRVKPTGVEVAGKVVAPAAVGQWIRIKITAPLDTAAGSWTLEVRQADGRVTTLNNLPNKNSAWKRLNWLGFVSDAAVASASSIGMIRATNTAP